MARKEPEIKSEKPYVNPEILAAEKTYKREVLVTEAGPKVKRLGLFLWFLLDALLLILFFGYLGFYLTIGSFTERRHIARIGENIEAQNEITRMQAAQDVQTSRVQVLSLGGSSYDFYVEMENPNADWYATFDYAFASDDERTELRPGFVLPLERRPLVAYGADFETRPSNVEVRIENMNWQRVNGHEMSDVEAWLADHDRFEVRESSYALETVGTEQVGKSTFTLKNGSPYSYKEVELIVRLERGGALLAVNTVTLTDFASSETREVSLTWFNGAPSSADVSVIPNVNFFDEENYAPLPSDLESDLRDTF